MERFFGRSAEKEKLFREGKQLEEVCEKIEKNYKIQSAYLSSGDRAEFRPRLRESLNNCPVKEELIEWVNRDRGESGMAWERLPDFMKINALFEFLGSSKCVLVLENWRELRHDVSEYRSIVKVAEKMWIQILMRRHLSELINHDDFSGWSFFYRLGDEEVIDRWMSILEDERQRQVLSWLIGRAEIFSDVDDREVWLDLCEKVSEEPGLAEVLRQYQESGKDWGTRLRLMEGYLASRGLGQVERGVVDRELVKLLTEENQRRFRSAGYRRRQQWLAGIRRQLTGEKLREIEKSLVEADRGKIQTERKLKQLARLEELGQPLEHLKVTLGYEIEFPKPEEEIALESMVFLGALGINMGIGDGDEFWETAPGPFLSARTATYIFMRWVQAGLIDLDKYRGLSFHLNMGLPDSQQRGERTLAKILKAVSYASRPQSKWTGSEGNPFEFQIYRNWVDGGRRFSENKGNTLQTVSGFAAQMRLAEGLGAALKAWQWRAMGKEELTLEQQALAVVWKELEKSWQVGCRAAGIPGLAGRQTTNLAMRELSKRVGKVFPKNKNGSDQWNRLRSSREVEDKPFEIEGKRYSNFVTFVRELAWQTVGKVEVIMNQAEREFGQVLEEVDQAEGEDRQQKMDVLFGRFPCGLRKNASRERKEKRLEELIANLEE